MLREAASARRLQASACIASTLGLHQYSFRNKEFELFRGYHTLDHTPLTAA